MSATAEAQEAADFVDILRVRFPRLTVQQAVQVLLERLASHKSVGVCFPDMSTLNLAAADAQMRSLLQRRLLVFNDGAGLAWAAQRRGRPLPANLNGTDLVPLLFAALPAETSVFILGARSGVAEAAQALLAQRFPHLRFVGSHHGYLDAQSEAEVVSKLHALRPQIVLVAMGNPLQLQFIDRHLDDPLLPQTMYLAVGGQLDYYGGRLKRAPLWMRNAKLEWLFILLQQPHKARRYLVGIPLFMLRCLLAERTHSHQLQEEVLS